MKKLLLILAVVLSVSASTLANVPQKEERLERLSPKSQITVELFVLDKELDLTDDQELMIQATLEAQLAQRQEAMAEAALSDREAIRQQMRADREQQVKQIKALLTEEQQAKYDEMLAENAKLRQEHRAERGERPNRV